LTRTERTIAVDTNPRHPVKLLALAYACEPSEGSEPGAGWMYARMLARLGETWVVTRANNRTVIEEELPTTPERDALHFVYVDLPSWARWWKRGTRGLRPYYLLWQLAALREARRLHHRLGFDLTWHVTLANAWLGSSGSLVGPPFVFGPVGGGVGPPWRLVPPMGVGPAVYELLRAAGRGTGRYANPLARVAWSRARTILVQNRETIGWLPRRHRHKAKVFPHVVLSRPPAVEPRTAGRPRTALFAGRLLSWKGVDLAIAAIAASPGWQLVVCGKGPDEDRLRRLAQRAGVADRVAFRGWVPRDEVLRIMREEAGVFLFPSLHDEAGWVLVEALAAELPIVCLDRGGPPLLAGPYAIVVSVADGRDAVVGQLTRALEQALEMPMTGSRDMARSYHIDERVEQLAAAVGAALTDVRR
jgi:glycosyltransferase involved in cell wall biosynthesis